MSIRPFFFASWLLLVLHANATDLNPAPEFSFEPSIAAPRSKPDHEASVIMRAQLYFQYGRPREAIRLLSEEIPIWDASEAEYIERACELLFAATYSKGTQNRYRDSFSKCPDSQTDVWFAEEERKYTPIVKYAPIMPREAVNNDITGYVIVEYVIDKKGNPTNITVVESTNEIFDKPTIRSVKQYRYLPSMKNGEPIETSGVRSKVTYQIEG